MAEVTPFAPGLYAITPDGLDTVLLMELVDAAIAGGARMIQYRDKSASPAERLVRAKALLALCRGRYVPLIVNDHVDLAKEIGADGVHLGRDDGAIQDARARLGAAAIVGLSCYASAEEALKGQAEGCTYLAFGSVFPSPTKPLAPAAPLAVFQAARIAGVSAPLVGIGGITPHNIGALHQAGASGAAVIQGIFSPAQRDAVFASARRLSLSFC